MKLLVKLWDRIPVKGPMIIIVAIIGAILAATSPFAGSGTCDSKPLRNVYPPISRLKVEATCQHVRFKVVAWRLEHDGDYHVNGTVLDAPRNEWVNAANVRSQYGYTVVEFVHGDPRPHEFLNGMILDLTCTKVRDVGHSGWFECHPVFAVTVEKAIGSALDPKRLAPPTETDKPAGVTFHDLPCGRVPRNQPLLRRGRVRIGAVDLRVRVRTPAGEQSKRG